MSAIYFTYFKMQWQLGKIDESYLNTMVQSGRLTPDEAEEIKKLPQVG